MRHSSIHIHACRSTHLEPLAVTPITTRIFAAAATTTTFSLSKHVTLPPRNPSTNISVPRTEDTTTIPRTPPQCNASIDGEQCNYRGSERRDTCLQYVVSLLLVFWELVACWGCTLFIVGCWVVSLSHCIFCYSLLVHCVMVVGWVFRMKMRKLDKRGKC